MYSPNTDTLPGSVAWLGYGGLLPFVGTALAVFVDPHHADLWSDALMAYGAVILSFVGALHWGFAMNLPSLDAGRRRACFIWSTVPALMAWPATLLVPLDAGLLLVTGFLLHYWQDRRLAARARLPGWYLPMRLRLTVVACASLLAGALLVPA